ncbi:MAG: hypothetical protein NC218_06520 [Acetobacter sp.]|nr:hypothetical protein [Acetobacter sp.]
MMKRRHFKTEDNKFKLWVKLAAGGVLAAIVVFYMSLMQIEAEIAPVPAVEPVEEPVVVRGGCQNAEDFVNANILLHEINSKVDMSVLLKDIRFEDGVIYYPEMEENADVLALVKDFFAKVDINSEADFANCVSLLERTEQFNRAHYAVNVQRRKANAVKAI